VTTVHGAHCDNVNQQFSIIGVEGNLGTADIGGTANTLPIGVNPINGGVFTNNYLMGTDGTAFALINNAGAPQICSQSYLHALAEGDIAGHTPFSKLGYNGNVGATEEDIWTQSSVYVFPASPMQMELVSSSAEDDPDKGGAVAGIGIHQVRIGYLDNTYASKSELVTLNGASPVSTVATNILRVNSIRATITGTGKVAAGIISCRMIGGAATVYRSIEVGFTRGRGLIYTVPLGKTLYLTSLSVASGHTTAGKIVRWIARATVDDYDNSVIPFFMAFFDTITQDNSFIRDFEMPVKIPATADLKVSAMSDGATSFASGMLRGWLE
jgi:hypothetical protein